MRNSAQTPWKPASLYFTVTTRLYIIFVNLCPNYVTHPCSGDKSTLYVVTEVLRYDEQVLQKIEQTGTLFTAVFCDGPIIELGIRMYKLVINIKVLRGLRC